MLVYAARLFIKLQFIAFKIPREISQGYWSVEFKDSLVNDYSFYSARVEDSKLQYGTLLDF